MDNQRPILYLALLGVLFIIWQTWQQDYGPKPAVEADAPRTADTAAAPKPPSDLPEPLVAAPEAPKAAAAPTSSERIRVVTDVLDLEIDTRGGDIRRSDLLTYPVSIEKPDVPVRLLDDTQRLYLAQSGLQHVKQQGVDTLARAPSHHDIYRAERTEYRLPAGTDVLKVPLTWTGPDGISVTKTYTFRRGQFLVAVDHAVTNAGPSEWVGYQYRQLRHGPISDSDGSRFIYTYTGSAYYDGAYQKLAFDDMADEPLDQDLTDGWVAILQHYFLSAWIPERGEQNRFYAKKLDNADEYIIGMRSPTQTLAPGDSTSFSSLFYVGPKIQEDLEAIAEGLELTVDYGIFTIFSKPLFWLLDKIHDLIGNWGWAIILVTVLIKLVFYKLSEASYRSMAKMRAVQPKLVALKERYADDKQGMNQALMDLYKKEKINPLGGCLPILIQIPVFIAFYWMLLESVEMRQAPFMFWIQDLSTKDPYFVLPILMGITMVVQQKLNPAPLDPVQQKVMMILPLVFTVFFAFFPSGLVLYWFVNNLLSIAQQWVITRRIEQGAKA